MVATIYILDDDPTYAKLLAANLGPAGRFRIDVFERPHALPARHADEPPDAVITDLARPDQHLVGRTGQLREAGPHLPIFVLTAHAATAPAADALLARANEDAT